MACPQGTKKGQLHSNSGADGKRHRPFFDVAGRGNTGFPPFRRISLDADAIGVRHLLSSG